MQGVERVLMSMTANLPEGYRIVVDNSAGGNASSVGLVWHAELNGMRVPNGQVIYICSHMCITHASFLP